jgi:hypothetical protein
MKVDEFADELLSARALDLICAVAEPQNVKARITQLAAATADYIKQREAAEKAMAEAEPTRAAAAELDQRTAQYQEWTVATEAKFRKREADIRNLEDLLAHRQAELTAAEANLAKRVVEHDDELARLRERLAS